MAMISILARLVDHVLSICQLVKKGRDEEEAGKELQMSVKKYH